jgi:UDPglucose 6-dehydrogenase
MEVANYWESVVRLNEWQEKRFVLNMLSNMFNTVAGKKIAVLGFAFKANTGDTRESPAIYITRGLVEEHAFVNISDPEALGNAMEDLKDIKAGIDYIEDPYKAAEGTHAIAVLTEWDIYRKLDYKRILDCMVRPAFIFDGRNTLDHVKLFEMGFNVFAIGKAPLKHF